MNKTRILIVEDELTLAKLLHRMLDDLGYSVSAMVSSGEEAIRQVGDMVPDLILMDIGLPGTIDGIEAAEQIKRQYDIPVIYLTAYYEDKILQRAKLTEPFGYVLKPIQFPALHSAIEIALYKRRVETKLRKNEESLQKLSQAVEQSPTMVVITDTEGNIEYANPKFYQITGYSPEQILNENPRFLKSGQQTQEVYKDMWQTITAGAEWRGEFHNKKQNGELFWASALISPIKNPSGKITHFLAVEEDITEKKNAEILLQYLIKRLEEEREQTQILARHVIFAQEEERRRLSLELHDEAGQALTALKLNLELIQSDLAPGITHQQLEDVIQLADETLERVRVLAQNLRPPGLDAMGINSTLEGFCREFTRRTQLSIDYNGTDLPEISEAISISLYRFLQEALTNIIKHAKADRIWVTLQADEHLVSLLVEDNGTGFNPAIEAGASQPFQGIGIAGMRERIELLKGTLTIESQPDKGTQLIADIPWEAKL